MSSERPRWSLQEWLLFLAFLGCGLLLMFASEQLLPDLGPCCSLRP